MKKITIDGQEYQLTPITQEKKLVVKKDFNFEIHPYELGKMNWREAVEKVKELGNEWRLPTITEIQLIRDSKHKDLFNKEWYWSSSEDYSNAAWLFVFSNGNTFSNIKSNNYYVRAVRDLTI
jgi:hypothetical protein